MGKLSFLLDTCTLLWWWSEPSRLSTQVLDNIKNSNNTILVSAASAWEIATKTRIGKLPTGRIILKDWEKRLTVDSFIELSISSKHSIKAGLLDGTHRDPFDRMLAAQSIIEHIPILTNDVEIAGLGATVLW